MIAKSVMSNQDSPLQPGAVFLPLSGPAKQHRLYDIDLEHKIAFCAVCGFTEIYVKESKIQEKPKVYCANRIQEVRQQSKKPLNEEKSQKPPKSPRHQLSEIDPEKMTAICAVCGPTGIRKDHKGYLCAKKARSYQTPYSRNYYRPRFYSPRVHSLTEVDEEKKTAVCSICGPVEIYLWQGRRKLGRRCSNASVIESPGAQKVRREMNTNVINRHKVEHGCKRCGYNENIHLLYLYGGSPEKKELKIEKLLKLAPKVLAQELENCEAFCVNCRSFVNYDLYLETLKASIDY